MSNLGDEEKQGSVFKPGAPAYRLSAASYKKRGGTTEMYFLHTFHEIPRGVQIDRWCVDVPALVPDRQHNV